MRTMEYFMKNTKAWMEEGWVLKLYPRNGLGFKYYSGG